MEDEKPKKFGMPGVRYLFAINGLLGFMVSYSMRLNINVAIVAMVNNTALHNQNNETYSNECRATDPISNNSMVDDNPKDGEFVWSPHIQGLVLGAFYYGYCVTQIPGGRLAELVGGKWVIGLANLATALLTLLVPTAARIHVGLLVAVRVMQGLAQGLVTPAMNSMLARWTPETERGLLYTLVHAGTNIGSLTTMSFAGVLAGSDVLGGWPACFYLFGEHDIYPSDQLAQRF
ncbi:hypothetical protein JTE90_015279 [Oedothorax gibbosus]|uniref:Major facilitator superfamily (MFS) profile domain-containing protein n=1 Tax=Oedothorax gibbosus TaxID=931172 RepID=A0AAV6UBP3_9ARAC|nr:hypothetical protein JTE90_015279 [Oedothorax gibbosus]